VRLGVSARGKTISESGKKALISLREPFEVDLDFVSLRLRDPISEERLDLQFGLRRNAFMSYSLVAFWP